MVQQFPAWLILLSWIFIGLAILSSIIIIIDIIGHPQKMRIMNLVWPVTGLYSGLIGLYAYYHG